MISRIVGTLLKADTKTRQWWVKLAVALILSNVFFFLLFSSPSTPAPIQSTNQKEGWVEVQMKAELMTPFQKGKKIVLINRGTRLSLEGVLQEDLNAEGKLTAWVKENEAHSLFQHSDWQVLPFIKNLNLGARVQRKENHEILY